MSILETYLSTLADLRSATVPETSYYAALQTLLNDAGAGLRPRVHAVIHPRDTGAGIPDLGLYDDNQPTEQKPAHGIVEAKPVSDDLLRIAGSGQVARYVAHYGQALVTNYYQFVLVTRNPETGQPMIEERYDLAPSASAFWEEVKHPRTLAQQHATALREHLMRVMRRSAPLSSSQDVAWMLASYAREAHARIEAGGTDLAALNAIRAQLEASLGVRFEDETAEDFFRSTLVQTLFYGVFSAWVLWHERHPEPDAKFDLWRDTRRLNVPVISELFEQFSSGAYLPLSVEQVLNWTVEALNRVDRPAFFHEMGYGVGVYGFSEFGDGSTYGSGKDAIQYFYEPFLEAFDPQLRRQLGVWYTPREVVQYMVARVDAALKEELGIADGLADPNVFILDPCCGTGAYLIEVLRHIAGTVRKRDGAALAGQAVQQAIRERVFGFELLPAPFVIAHLQIGLLLNQLKAPLETGQRAGVYLTNALTGWEPPKEPKPVLLFPELQKERDAADAVKRSNRILVVIGNPPYNAFAGTSAAEEGGFIDIYKTGLQTTWGIKKFNLDDLFVRFFRLAERCITELSNTGRGIVCYISSFSYLDDPSYVVMRQRFLSEFDRLSFDSLNGDSRETGKRIPSGLPNAGAPDPSVFSTSTSREGIRVGTAIALMVRKPKREPVAQVRFRDFWGASKLKDLLASLTTDFDSQYQVVTPSQVNRYSFKPQRVTDDYLSWFKLSDLCAVPPYNGPVERRGFALIDSEREIIRNRFTLYFNPAVPDEQVAQLHPKLMMTGNRIVGTEARKKILARFKFNDSSIVRYPLKPFDIRWCYLENLRPLFSEPSPELLSLRDIPDNAFFISRDTADKTDEGVPFYYSSLVCDYDLLSGHARHFPLFVRRSTKSAQTSPDQLVLFENDSTSDHQANLSSKARDYLTAFGITDVDTNRVSAALIWLHALAIGFSPAYLREHADGIKGDWPRVPFPKTRHALEASAALGRQIAALLDVESPVPGVTQGDPRPELRSIGVLTASSGTPDFTINVNWGYFGSASAVMPGRGRAVEADGLIDVYLNASTYWKGIPAAVWEYTLGGYQVLKKWLSYRETDVLGRPLKAEEAREFMHIARRIAALLALNESLDVNYRAVLFDQHRP